MLGQTITWRGRVLVLGLSGEAFMGALPIALGLEGMLDADVEALTLAHIGDGQPWSAAVASWYREQSRPVNVCSFDDLETPLGEFDHIVAVGTSFEPKPPASVCAHPGAVFALVAAGVEAFELSAIRARVLELSAVGGLSVEHIARFGRVGREYVELVEHVNHVTGPTGQSRVADTLRAALFGKSGRVAVNLASRENPPELDPLTTMVFYVDVREL